MKNDKLIVVMYRTFGIYNGRGYQPYHIFKGLIKENLLEKMFVFRLRDKKDKNKNLKPLPFLYLAFIFILLKLNSFFRFRKVGAYLFNLPFFDLFIYLNLYTTKNKTIIFNYFPSEYLLKMLTNNNNKIIGYFGHLHPTIYTDILAKGKDDLNYIFDYKNIDELRRQKLLLKYFDKYIVMSHYSKETWEKENKQILITPLGVENIENKIKQKNKNNKIVFLYVGRITYEKGLKYLLDAWESFKNFNNIELIFIGGMNTQEKEYFENRFKKIKNFKYLGYQNTMEVLKQSDILIHPTLTGGFEKVTLEAMKMGLPIITTKPAAHFVQNNINGFVINRFSSKQIEEKIKYFIDNIDKIEQFSKKSIELSSFQTWDKFESDFIDAVKELIK